ncbi:ROK family transcriptional regulator [Clostridium sp. NSJ-49]|nr:MULTISPECIES: ROK family transcriptional regulator [Clostridium]MBC5624656.1 ROK family transcriptional regulator [Clostridium sp. NSJ-49]MCD2501276.1 ROK family transcriptional regulator [Clostridium sp. NSJ-145]MDU6341663.1 ROK family transcriptional regulator [Clostridium sp.]
MNKVVKGSFELMKKLNVEAILKVIKNNGSLSRADIAKLTGLTPASVTNITKILIESDYLIERGIGESNGGRPPIILEINIKARYIIGVSIGVGSIDVVLTDLGAEILAKKSIYIDENNTNKEFVFTHLINLINEVIEISEVNRDKVVGIGVAMHGVVNPMLGISQYAPYYKWENVNIKLILEEKFKCPVFVDNDVRAIALGESLFGAAKSIDNFVEINISNGIGAGIIIDNKPYYGVDYSAGEIGHMVVEQDGSLCKCGNYGCLESVASNISVERKVIRSIKQGVKSSLVDDVKDIEKINIKDISIAASKGDELAISVLKEAARYIGVGISGLVNILNPKLIVVVGDIFEQEKIMIETLSEVVKKRGLKIPSENVKIVKSDLGENAAVIGAATLVIQEVFKGREFM